MARKKLVAMGVMMLVCSALSLPGAEPTPDAQAAVVEPSPGDAPLSVSEAPPDETSAVVYETPASGSHPVGHTTGESQLDFMSMLFVFMLATFIGLGVISRVSRLLHTPLMSLTNAISAISVVGAIMVAGNPHYSTGIRLLGSIALFASMTNIISGFLITDRMLKMFKTREVK